jgi:hypothetical protein
MYLNHFLIGIFLTINRYGLSVPKTGEYARMKYLLLLYQSSCLHVVRVRPRTEVKLRETEPEGVS